jgi:hypothetical protein
MNLVVSIIPIFYSIQPFKSICQVFQEGATFRGKMKDYCRSMFLQYYSNELGLNAMDEFPGQLDYQENISRNVWQLIGKASLWTPRFIGWLFFLRRKQF